MNSDNPAAIQYIYCCNLNRVNLFTFPINDWFNTHRILKVLGKRANDPVPIFPSLCDFSASIFNLVLQLVYITPTSKTVSKQPLSLSHAV